jgi:hypothetical protein
MKTAKFLAIHPWLFRSISIICLLAVAQVSALSQAADTTAPLRRLAFIEGRFTLMTTDPLQQVYVVDDKNSVYKYSPAGQLLFQYNDNRLGRLGAIDASNPFNVLLYYPDYQVAVTLDRTLNKTGAFQLFQLGTVNPVAVTLSMDNHLWLFDEISSQLRKIGHEGAELARSDNLSLLLGARPNPVQISAHGNYIYAADPNLGILVFDLFGQYDRLIPLSGVDQCQAFDYFLLCRRGDLFELIDTRTMQNKGVAMPARGKALRVERGLWFVLMEDGVGVFGE